MLLTAFQAHDTLHFVYINKKSTNDLVFISFIHPLELNLIIYLLFFDHYKDMTNCFSLGPSRQTAVEVFKRIILEAEKMDGGAPQGRTPCSLM